MKKGHKTDSVPPKIDKPKSKNANSPGVSRATMVFNDTNIDLENPESRKCDPDLDSFKARILRKCKAAQNRLKQDSKNSGRKGEIWMFELY